MKIIIDGMGGDNAPAEIVKGTVEALSVIDGEIVLVGDEKVLTEELRKYSGKYPEERVSIRHASEVIFNEEAFKESTGRRLPAYIRFLGQIIRLFLWMPVLMRSANRRICWNLA